MYWPNLLGSPKPSKMTNSFAAIEVVHQCIAMFAQFPATDRLIRPNQDAHHQRLDRLFFGSRLKGAAHLGRTSLSSIPCPPPSPARVARHTCVSTNQQPAAAQQKKSRLASPNLWWVHCIGWRERVCTKLIEAGMPAAASSLLQLTKLASKPG